ncbi:MAG TPA: CRISPR-associated endonuclease Cas2 [Eggerthellaceae bacterium]|nr:CRISPR-associated endonuclease Cas2 [Eggerthellaceae bacterium]
MRGFHQSSCCQRFSNRQQTAEERESASLVKLQSTYAKLVTNDANAGSAIARLRKHRPPEGLVQVLKVTERQFETMVFITGNREAYDEVDTMEEFLVL